jgi:ferredoxin-NADP reductase
VEGGAVLGGLTWQTARVVGRRPEHPACVSLRLALDPWTPHLPGQHYVVRLTAPDGYTAQRSYSVASAPEDTGEIELTVDRLPDGEVSPYLCDEVAVGDELEVRGPIGGWFTWHGESPALLVGGGSGVVPLMAMLRHRRAAGAAVPARLLLSARTVQDILYADELHALGAGDHGPEVTITLTRESPPGWSGYDRRVDRELLDAVAWAPAQRPRVYVCGPTAFVEEVAADLVALGHDPGLVKTERFGPTGGG